MVYVKNNREKIICKDDIMARRFSLSYGLIRAANELKMVIQGIHPDGGLDTGIFSSEQRREIREFAMSYTERVLITGNSQALWGIVASIFPASSFCAAIKFNMAPAEVLRLIEDDRSDGFVISKYLELDSARMTKKIDSRRAELMSVCREVRECFCDIYRLDRCTTEEERIRALREQCYSLSYFCGCPIELSFNNGGNGFANIDFPLLSAFLYTMLISARNNAPRREAEISFTADGHGVSVVVEFEASPELCLSPEQLEWTGTAANKGMFLSFFNGDGRLRAELRPLIDESVYTEIKQRFGLK